MQTSRQAGVLQLVYKGNPLLQNGMSLLQLLLLYLYLLLESRLTNILFQGRAD